MTEETTRSEQQRGHVARAEAPGEGDHLVPAEEASELRTRWDAIQAGFVDDPRRAVEDANELVEEVTRRAVETFTRSRAALEEQWSRGDEVTTEELRVVLQRYRSFFDALLRTGAPPRRSP